MHVRAETRKARVMKGNYGKQIKETLLKRIRRVTLHMRAFAFPIPRNFQRRQTHPAKTKTTQQASCRYVNGET